MKEKIKNNMNIYLSIFSLCQPILDLLTGFSLHTLKINLTIGIIIRVLFLFMMIISSIFIFKKKKLLIPYSIIFLYIIFYIIGIFLYKDGNNLFSEIQGVIKVFYFPSLLLSIYSIKEEIHISKLTYLTTLFLYLIFIFVPTLFGLGYKTYEVTKAGTLGFFNSANEISGIISILTPYLLILLVTTKRLLPKIG
ncbi:MAG: O-antigen ligase family protein, partial [Bacilli bacterium]|nr:O-antigen ligase family protein [Bacilli bacterium]